jgi:hypothetical protein
MGSIIDDYEVSDNVDSKVSVAGFFYSALRSSIIQAYLSFSCFQIDNLQYTIIPENLRIILNIFRDYCLIVGRQ